MQVPGPLARMTALLSSGPMAVFLYSWCAPTSPNSRSNNRDMGTPEENKAVVQGSITYFGTYSVDEADGTLTLHIERCSFPELEWHGSEATDRVAHRWRIKVHQSCRIGVGI